MILQLFLLTLIVIQIIDISGFVTSIKRGIWRAIKGKDKPYIDFPLKPFDCSYCMTFWCGLIYLIINGSVAITLLLYLLGLCFATTYIKDFQLLIGDFLTKIMNKMYDALNK